MTNKENRRMNLLFMRLLWDDAKKKTTYFLATFFLPDTAALNVAPAVNRATVVAAGKSRNCHLEMEYKFYDRYNWDGGKSVTIGGVEITDEAMGEFHLQGMAREYDEIGSFKRVFDWTAL